VGTDGQKNIDWIDTDNRLTAKNKSMVGRRKKNLKPMDPYYWSKIKCFSPMIDTIGQTSKIF
jgi:hypothetical protein